MCTRHWNTHFQLSPWFVVLQWICMQCFSSFLFFPLYLNLTIVLLHTCEDTIVWTKNDSWYKEVTSLFIVLIISNWPSCFDGGSWEHFSPWQDFLNYVCHKRSSFIVNSSDHYHLVEETQQSLGVCRHKIHLKNSLKWFWTEKYGVL